ncbi:hypothetical protein WJX77_003521 [Trebouxia sp. C0004]
MAGWSVQASTETAGTTEPWKRVHSCGLPTRRRCGCRVSLVCQVCAGVQHRCSSPSSILQWAKDRVEDGKGSCMRLLWLSAGCEQQQ